MVIHFKMGSEHKFYHKWWFWTLIIVLLGLIAVLIISITPSYDYTDSGSVSGGASVSTSPSGSSLNKEDIYVVSAGYVHSTCWDSEDNLEVSALIKASNPVDVYWVPDKANVDLFINNLAFTHYPECYKPSVLQSNIVCVIDGDGCLMVSNEGSESSSVSVLLTAD